jgi:hypothetical protein
MIFTRPPIVGYFVTRRYDRVVQCGLMSTTSLRGTSQGYSHLMAITAACFAAQRQVQAASIHERVPVTAVCFFRAKHPLISGILCYVKSVCSAKEMEESLKADSISEQRFAISPRVASLRMSTTRTCTTRCVYLRRFHAILRIETWF